MRIHPITGEHKHHTGIDLVKPHQYPIPAFLSGVVRYSGWAQSGSGIGGYGNVVLVEDEWNHINMYTHLDSLNVVRGQMLKRGDIVGRQGSTGQSTGSHLHFEVRSRTSPYWGWKYDVDPSKYLASRRWPVPPDLKAQRVISIVYRGRPVPIDSYLMNATTYVPLRWLAETAGFEVEWREETGGTVYVR